MFSAIFFALVMYQGSLDQPLSTPVFQRTTTGNSRFGPCEGKGCSIGSPTRIAEDERRNHRNESHRHEHEQDRFGDRCLQVCGRADRERVRLKQVASFGSEMGNIGDEESS
jgi:hypothetical protein